MLFKTLTDLYFDNKVKTVPEGALNFFDYADKIVRFYEKPDPLMGTTAQDLERLIKGAEKVTIAFAECSGQDRYDEIGKKMVGLLSGNNTKRASDAFFHIVGSEDTTLDDVAHVAESITGMLDSDTEVTFGAQIEDGINDKARLYFWIVEKN